MREILNGILSFIGAESLTDEEYASIIIEDGTDNREIYLALRHVLAARELTSNMYQRLAYYFKAKGVSISEKPESRSNIFVGSSI